MRANANKLVPLALAIATNLFLAGVFLNVLLHPTEHIDFIYKTGIVIFVVEFMTLHSSGMFFANLQQKKKPMSWRTKIAFIGFYTAMVLAYSLFAGQWLIAGYFFASLVAKAFFSNAVEAEKRMSHVAAGIVMLLLSTFLVIAFGWLLVDVFPFPAEVMRAKPANSGGLFVDTPQTLLGWGMTYFLLMCVCEIVIYRRQGSRPSTGLDEAAL